MHCNRLVVAALLVTLPTASFAQIPSPPPEPGTPAPALVLSAAALDRAIQQGCDSSRTAGRSDADERHGTAGWFAGGVGAGVGLGLIGTGIITGASALGSPQPREVPAAVDEDCYRDGYKSKAKNKNVVSSLLGGLIGTGVWLVILVAANSD